MANISGTLKHNPLIQKLNRYIDTNPADRPMVSPVLTKNLLLSARVYYCTSRDQPEGFE